MRRLRCVPPLTFVFCIIGFGYIFGQHNFPSDTIYLRNGATLEGRILRVDENRVQITYDLPAAGAGYTVMKKGILKISYGNHTVDHIGTGTVFVPGNAFERKLPPLSVGELTEMRSTCSARRKKARPIGIAMLVAGSFITALGGMDEDLGRPESRYKVLLPLGVGISLTGMFGIAVGVSNRKRIASINSELERRGIDPINDSSRHPLLQ